MYTGYLQEEFMVEQTFGIEMDSEHGLVCLAWSDCPFEPAKLVIGGYSSRAVVWTLDANNRWREVSVPLCKHMLQGIMCCAGVGAGEAERGYPRRGLGADHGALLPPHRHLQSIHHREGN